jgi:hypothetical protein
MIIPQMPALETIPSANPSNFPQYRIYSSNPHAVSQKLLYHTCHLSLHLTAVRIGGGDLTLAQR